MAFTQADLDKIDADIANGTLRLRSEDSEIWYRRLDDMLRIRRMIAAEVSGDTTGLGRRRFVSFKRGL